MLMIRTLAPSWLAFGIVTLVAGAAVAEPTQTTSDPDQAPAQTGQRTYVVTPAEAFVPHAVISQTLYLERCTGGCTINKGGINDARTNTSTIPSGTGPFTVSEYVNAAGQNGAMADDEWNQVVQCVKEVYSPFDVDVTDVKPPAGVSFHLALVAGTPPEIGLGNDILGIAPLAGDCSPSDNVISFSFANAHGNSNRVHNLCWTAAQESAHAFGLDHEFAYQDGRSACNDPMTYRTDCGGQKFFRNEVASCGEFEARPCRCGANQNSHLKIQAVFGPGMAITGAPTSTVTLPLPNTTLGAVIGVQAGSKRGISKVELRLNGFKWAETKGAVFGTNGQANPSSYTIPVPAEVPNSIVDVVARAYDDLGAYTDSAPVTVTKGPIGGCTSAEACADGQKCEAGKCFWDPPTGELGDPCSYAQACVSLQCSPTADNRVCTQTCIPGVTDSCPTDMQCIEESPGRGFCYVGGDDGGCCSVGKDSRSLWAQLGLSFGVLGFLAIRRRRR